MCATKKIQILQFVDGSVASSNLSIQLIIQLGHIEIGVVVKHQDVSRIPASTSVNKNLL